MNDNWVSQEQETELFSMKNFLLLCLGYWKWFLFSLIVCVGLGVVYLLRTEPVYERSEEILIKDQDSGGGIGDITNAFSSLGLFSSNTKVYNELIAFTSPAVMMEVVDRLNLTMNYELKKGIKTKTLYRSSLPVNVEFLDLTEKDNVGFRITLQTDGSYEITKIWRLTEDGKQKYDKTVGGVISQDPVSTPIGRVAVNYNPEYTGGAEIPEKMEIQVFKQSRQLAVEKYVNKLKGDLSDQDADVINLSIKDTSIERADDILNMVVVVYNERWIKDNNRVSETTSKFISERLAVIENELNEIDEKVAQMKSEMGTPDIEEAAKGILAQEFKINEERRQISNMLAMSKFLKDYLEDSANDMSVIPFNTGTENQILEQQISHYNDILRQRNNLLANSGEESPLVKPLTQDLNTMKAAILKSVNSHIANLTNTLSNIEKDQAATKVDLSSSPQQAKNLLSVERQQLVLHELYLFLLQKKEENDLTQKFTADNTRIITPPYGKEKPVSPNKPLILILAVVLGFAIPGTALFLAESSNTKIRSKKDLENLPVPFAGEIPNIGKRRRLRNMLRTKKSKAKAVNKPRIVVTEGKRDIPNEAFRVVRSNIDFMIGRGEKSVIALTSFNPGSGKSFIAYNLGASFALKGKKVLIIDGDLRHGSMSAYVNSPRKGLTTYLTGNVADWKPLVVKSQTVDNLSVLPIGHRPPNPAELLDNGRLQVLLEEARTVYDIILIDCPPVNIVVDTQIINQYVSRTIFVVRAGLLEKKALKDLAKIVEEKKLKNITVLLNGTKTQFSTYHTYGNYEAIDAE